MYTAGNKQVVGLYKPPIKRVFANKLRDLSNISVIIRNIRFFDDNIACKNV